MDNGGKNSPEKGRGPESGKTNERLARRAAALRENLRKRKAQQREREEKPD